MPHLSDLSPEKREELIRACWYAHDARWFTSVAQEFGLEAANKLNQRTLRALGHTEVRILKAFGLPQVKTMEEFVTFFEACRQVLVPPPLMESTLRIVDARSYEICVERCFVHESVVRAGIGESYECAVFERIRGWHDGLNLPLAEELPALPCAKVQGRECRRRLTLR